METAPDVRASLRRSTFVAGAIMFAGSLIGVGGLVYGMIHSYETIGNDPPPTPDELAVGVSIFLDTLIFAGVVVLIGMVLFIRARSRLNKLDEELAR